ncbi:DUF5931 domain-containing protein, partial [Saccharopolyspora kobensis]
MSSPLSNEPRVTDGRSPLWRGHNVFRVVTFFYACAWVIFQFDSYARPWLAVVVLVLMGLWTAFTVWRYSKRCGRTDLLVALDQVVVTVLFMSSEFILTEEQMTESWPTVVTAWHPTMITAAAAQWGMSGGIASGIFAAGCNFLLRWKTSPDMVLDTVLLIGVGAVIGLASNSARSTTARLARALRAEAATAER